MPYESQPFQQFFIKNIKEKISKKIKVTGYIHSFYLRCQLTIFIENLVLIEFLFMEVTKKKFLRNF